MPSSDPVAVGSYRAAPGRPSAGTPAARGGPRPGEDVAVRFGLLTQWYDPEPGPAALPGVLARGLAQRGHDVHVLTGFPNYPTGRVADGYRNQRRLTQRLDGVTVTRVGLYPSHDASFLRRSLNYASFGASALVNGLPALRGLDALWVNYSPVTVAPAMWAAKAAYGVPLVVHVGDLWPDTLHAGGFAPTGPTGRVFDATLRRWCRAMYDSAAVVSYISPGVRDVLRDRGVPQEKLAYVPNWAEESTFAPIVPAEQERLSVRSDLGYGPDDVVLLYAGALGEAQGLQTLLEAAARVPRDVPLRVLIAGSGTAEDALRGLAARLGLLGGGGTCDGGTCDGGSGDGGSCDGGSCDGGTGTCDGGIGDACRGAHPGRVRFLGRVPQSDMPRLMSTADACYVGLRADPLSRLTMPSKTQATLACAKALVVAADGDVARVAEASGAGLAVRSGDVTALADALRVAVALGRDGLRARGARGRAYYVATFSVSQGISRTERALRSAAGTRQRT